MFNYDQEMITRRLIRLAFALIILSAAVLHGEIIDRIVAVANDQVITLDELEQAYREDPMGLKQEAEQADGREITKEEYLGHMLDMLLVEQEVKRQGINIDELEIKKAMDNQLERMGLNEEQFQQLLDKKSLTLDQYKTQLRRQIIMVRLVGKEVRSEVTVSAPEIENYYAQHKNEFRTGAKYHVRHFFLPYPEGSHEAAKYIVRDQLQLIRNEIEAGADFAEMARKYSRGPSAPQGGDLGWFEEGDLLDVFQRQVAGLKVGEMSPVFESEPGFHILKLEDKVEGKQISLEEARKEIEATLYDQKVMERYSLWMKRLSAKAHVEVKYP